MYFIWHEKKKKFKTSHRFYEEKDEFGRPRNESYVSNGVPQSCLELWGFFSYPNETYFVYFAWFNLANSQKLHEFNRPHEMRCVERKVLLEALAPQIPKRTIQLNSQVTSIKMSKTSPNFTNLELQDGSTYSAKVWIICSK
jgi:hypothetical protein